MSLIWWDKHSLDIPNHTVQTEPNFPQTLAVSKTLSGRPGSQPLTVVEPDGLVAGGSGDEVELRELHVAGDVDPSSSGPLVGEVRGGVPDCDRE